MVDGTELVGGDVRVTHDLACVVDGGRTAGSRQAADDLFAARRAGERIARGVFRLVHLDIEVFEIARNLVIAVDGGHARVRLGCHHAPEHLQGPCRLNEESSAVAGTVQGDGTRIVDGGRDQFARLTDVEVAWHASTPHHWAGGSG
jgi:hypothetical protein